MLMSTKFIWQDLGTSEPAVIISDYDIQKIQ